MVHGIKKNMQNKFMDLSAKILLRKRNIIEIVFDYLKNKMNLEHTMRSILCEIANSIIKTTGQFKDVYQVLMLRSGA